MKRSSDSKGEIEDIYSKVALVERNNKPCGYTLVNPIKVAKKGHKDIVELAKEIEKADNFIHANACNKLQVLAQQVRFLQEQARNILQEAKVNSDLHHAACNFVKVPGTIYHLYKRPSGQSYFGMLSPKEWNNPHEYIGSFRLEYDQSWTPIDKIPEKDNEMGLTNKLFGMQKTNFALLETPMDFQ